MPDLYGDLLPYTTLDDLLERVWGPVVVRRKILHGAARGQAEEGEVDEAMASPPGEWARVPLEVVREALAQPPPEVERYVLNPKPQTLNPEPPPEIDR